MVYTKIKKFFEKKLPLRGVTLVFIIDKITDKSLLREVASEFESSPFAHIFYSSKKVDTNKMSIEITLTETDYCVNTSEIDAFYRNYFKKCVHHFEESFKLHHIKIEPSDFRILFRLYPIESRNEFIPLFSLENVAKEWGLIFSSLEIPQNNLEFKNYLMSVGLSETSIKSRVDKGIKEGKQIYSSFGVKKNNPGFFVGNWLSKKELDAIKNKWVESSIKHCLIIKKFGLLDNKFQELGDTLLSKCLEMGFISEEQFSYIKTMQGEVTTTYGLPSILSDTESAISFHIPIVDMNQFDNKKKSEYKKWVDKLNLFWKNPGYKDYRVYHKTFHQVNFSKDMIQYGKGMLASTEINLDKIAKEINEAQLPDKSLNLYVNFTKEIFFEKEDLDLVDEYIKSDYELYVKKLSEIIIEQFNFPEQKKIRLIQDIPEIKLNKLDSPKGFDLVLTIEVGGVPLDIFKDIQKNWFNELQPIPPRILNIEISDEFNPHFVYNRQFLRGK